MNIDLARQQMVRQQVRTTEVFNASVLQALTSLSRQNFVPSAYRQLAYADTEIPLAHEQKMMTPMIEGRLLQSLALTEDSRVLEIGTGSAFLTACLSRLAFSVYSVDIFDNFISAAAGKLAQAGLDNVHLECMDVIKELPDGEFDAIAVTASLARFDDRYIERLRPGGRLFIVVGSGPVHEARIVVRDNGGGADWNSAPLFETWLTPMVNSVVPESFAF